MQSTSFQMSSLFKMRAAILVSLISVVAGCKSTGQRSQAKEDPNVALSYYTKPSAEVLKDLICKKLVYSFYYVDQTNLGLSVMPILQRYAEYMILVFNSDKTIKAAIKKKIGDEDKEYEMVNNPFPGEWGDKFFFRPKTGPIARLKGINEGRDGEGELDLIEEVLNDPVLSDYIGRAFILRAGLGDFMDFKCPVRAPSVPIE